MLSLIKRSSFIICMLAAFVALTYASIPYALSDTTDTATIMGQVTVNSVATNGVTVTCGSLSPVTTGNYMGQDGIYVISDVPYGTSMPFTASYENHTYTDTVDPLTDNGQSMYWLGTVDISIPVDTPTPAPTITPTPDPNSTATPTPEPNSTITPTPTATPTATPVPTSTPAPTAAATPVPAISTPVPYTATQPAPVPTYSPSPSAEAQQPAVEEPTAAASSLILSTPAPSPTTTRSPGFESLMALIGLTGVAYVVTKKRR